MEHEQAADTREGVGESTAPVGTPPAGDVFVFRPLVSVQTPAPPAEPADDPPAKPGFSFAHAPDRAERLTPQDALRENAKAYFHRLLTQYWTFPTNEADPTACVHYNLQAISIIYSLVAKSERDVLTYADLHQLEMALLRVMPEAVLRCEAPMLRARYRAVAPPALFRRSVRSKPRPEDDAAAPIEALRAEMATLLGQIQHCWVFGDTRMESRAAAWRVSACWALGLCVMGALGFAAALLLPIPPKVAPAVPLLTALLGGAAAASAYIRREHP